jgi:hypothetical protein
MSTKPCRFAVTPTIGRWSGKVNLALEFDSIDCKNNQVQVVVPDDRAVLVFLEDLAPGVHRTVWIEPRIVKSDCEWRLHDWLLKLTQRLKAFDRNINGGDSELGNRRAG